MQVNQVELRGLHRNDLQDIYDNALRELKTRLFFLDASYMYTFQLEDFKNVRAFNLLGRYYAEELRRLAKAGLRKTPEYKVATENNSLYCRYWHSCLEQWFDDKQADLGGRMIRPIDIARTLDRVVNQGMEMLAGCVVGEGDAIFNWRAIGDGTGGVSLADFGLSHQVDMIDVNNSPEGGSLNRDGTTIYSTGNHSKEVETPDNGEFTECGMFDAESNNNILDHSEFDDPIEHEQNAEAPGSTTVIYMCSG